MLLSKIAPLLNISTIWSLMVACTSASILHLKPSCASTRNDLERSTRSSISNNSEMFFRKSVTQNGSLDKRGKDLDLALSYFEPAGLLLPIQAAAEALEAFYTSIAISAHRPWSNNVPRIWIRMTSGTIGLLMTATEGSTIPWDFVTWFALQMLRHTERGYTGMYTANYVNPTLGNAIWVSLYQCTIGPLTDPGGIGAPAKVVSCLNANAPAWFPTKRTPTLDLYN